MLVINGSLVSPTEQDRGGTPSPHQVLLGLEKL